ncbi:MAG: flavodoxin family protein, partial [Candidatus Ornithomonoglobus sp.]
LAACLDGSEERGVIFGTGVYEAGEIKNTPAFVEAYKMGLNV